MARSPSSTQQDAVQTAFRTEYPDYATRFDTPEKIANELNRRFSEQQGTFDRGMKGRFSGVQNLFDIGALIHTAQNRNFITTGRNSNLRSWLQTNGIKYNYSYMTRALRFFNDRDNIGSSVIWYQTNDADRKRTGYDFLYRVGQPTGVVFVTDCLRGYRQYNTVVEGVVRDLMNAGESLAANQPKLTQAEADALRSVDVRFPMTPRRVVRETISDEDNGNRQTAITPALLAARERACLIAAVTALTAAGLDDPLGDMWDNPPELSEWLDDATTFTMEHLRATRFLPASWDVVYPDNAAPWGGYDDETPDVDLEEGSEEQRGEAPEPPVTNEAGELVPPPEGDGNWRAVRAGEVFQPGRSFRMNLDTRVREVWVPTGMQEMLDEAAKRPAERKKEAVTAGEAPRKKEARKMQAPRKR